MTVRISDLETLVERCKLGDSQAQYSLYNRYADKMYNVSLRIVGNNGEAEDVVQVSFIQAFKNVTNLKTNLHFSAWLKKIVVNRSIDFLRNKGSLDTVSLDDEEIFVQLPQETLHWGDENTDEQLIEEIKAGIDLLPDGYKTVLSLYLLEGYDHQEVAGMLGIAESTSRTQYMRAKEKLRNMVADNIKNYE